MSLPFDPTLDCSAAEYSLGNKGRAPLTNSQGQRNMYNSPRPAQQEQQQRTVDSPPPPKGSLERFRDYVGRTCCSCFLKKTPPPQLRRENHIFVKPDPLDDEDDVMDDMRRDGIRIVHGIPSNVLLPPNVSLCEGFGFACTNQPIANLPSHVLYLGNQK
ncbi:hypothetical protein NECAME_00673 [Necator americanus]|uniref:Uncharacterized protein n=1 Tax=Necator americanus TaxID=51031 RepID=W2T2S9_NECAM|nr:hypothetical protein NECAME_00673 [Necator americanus]ETN75262.1 hypothetical protein NECAME_00673 [Necator americanus]